MKYKIKVGEKYLVGENPKETLKGTVAGDTTAVFSRVVKEMSAYDFCDNIEDADAKDCLTACDYIRGLMDRQNYGFYLGEIKLIDADAEETVVHCNREENAKIIAHILEFDSQNMVYDWYEQHIANIAKYYEGKSNSPENPDSSAVNVVRCKDCRYFYDGYDEKCCIVPVADVVARDCYDRILAENDTMREQLAQIGKKPGDSMDDVRPVVMAFWVGEMDGVGICSNCKRLDHIDPLATHCRYCGAEITEPQTLKNASQNADDDAMMPAI